MAKLMAPPSTSVYRLYARDGALLYVGVAGNPGRRFQQHAHDKYWWGDVASMRLEHFATRAEAEDAERLAIQTECPKYNVVFNEQNADAKTPRLKWACEVCNVDIRDGEGYLEVFLDDLFQYRAQLPEETASRGTVEYIRSRVLDAEQLAAAYGTRWGAFHAFCDPDPDATAVYCIAVEQLRTERDVLRWTGHLIEKDWLASTNWSQLLIDIGRRR